MDAVPKRRNRNWIWLYAVIFILTASAISINLAFNLRQQLTTEQLKNAKELWAKNGPADYELTITKDLGGGGEGASEREVIHAKIRNHKVVAATRNDKPMEERLLVYNSMPAWFDFIEEFHSKDTNKNAPRVFCRARFHETDGHILHFVRSCRAKNERVELRIEMKK